MSRQLRLRVSDEFAERLERVSQQVGLNVAALLESVVTPALESVEADALFETEALSAWEEYQLNGRHVNAEELDALFRDALDRAARVSGSQSLLF